PEGDAHAVRRAGADEHLRVPTECRRELGHEPRLADPGCAENRDELRQPLLDAPVERLAKLCKLALAADEWRIRAARDDRGARDGSSSCTAGMPKTPRMPPPIADSTVAP